MPRADSGRGVRAAELCAIDERKADDTVPHQIVPITGQRYAQERQQWEHDRSDWEHWRVRLQEDLDAARAGAGLDARKGLAAQLAQADERTAAERASLERWGYIFRGWGTGTNGRLPLLSNPYAHVRARFNNSLVPVRDAGCRVRWLLS
jgi:hypothetical protein